MAKLALLLLLGVLASVHADCELYDATNALETSLPPKIVVDDSGFFDPDYLTLKISVSTKYTSADIEFEDASADLAKLTPSTTATLWEETSDDCWIYFTLTILWSDFNEGGLGGMEMHEYVSSITFSGIAIVTMKEYVAIEDQGLALYHERTVSDKLVFVVEFPTIVTTDADITIYNSPVDLAAIIEQHTGSLDPHNIPHAKIDVELMTILQDPFKYEPTTVEIVTTDPFLSNGLISGIKTDCLLAGPTCEQVWAFEIYPATCEVQGTFTVHLNLMCKPDVDCPLDETSDTDTITFEIATSNFCPQTIATIGIYAEMFVYKEAGHINLKDDFFTNQFAYFKARAMSDEASISSTSVVEITTWDPYYPLFLPLNVPPYPHPDADCFIETPGATPNDEAWFHFFIHPDLFLLPNHGSAVMRVHATLEVEFVGNALLEATHPSIKKLLEKDDVRSLEISSELGYEESEESVTESTTGSSTSTTSTSTDDSAKFDSTFVGLLAAFVLLLGGTAGFGIGRYSATGTYLIDHRRSSGIDVESSRRSQTQ